MIRIRDHLVRLSRIVAVGAVSLLSTGAAAPSDADAAVEVVRVSACSAQLEEMDPAQYLPGEVSALFVSDCRPGTSPCKPACCSCCDPTYEVCCDVTCVTVCQIKCAVCG
jgi:hypothetical protein